MFLSASAEATADGEVDVTVGDGDVWRDSELGVPDCVVTEDKLASGCVIVAATAGQSPSLYKSP